MWRNCSLSLCKVKELFTRSDMYGFEFVIMVVCKIRFNVSARYVPRCGVARNMIADIALMIDWYSGSFWP